LERFFNHETASSDGDAKARLILIACATGLPGFMVALYLWPAYHPFPGWPPGHPSNGGLPPYWLHVNHHFFFVLYSFVAMGVVTIFEWDMFFPDLLDLFVLTTLPVPDRRLFQARVAAIAIFISGFLFDANFMAPLVLLAVVDPPNPLHFFGGHLLAVAASGLFSAAFILAVQGVLLAVFGERIFMRLSLLIQGLLITVLMMLMLLFPVLSGAVPVFLESGSVYARCFPPFWFLGVYQRVLEGTSAMPIYSQLARLLYSLRLRWRHSPIHLPICEEHKCSWKVPARAIRAIGLLFRCTSLFMPRCFDFRLAARSSTSSARPCCAFSGIASIWFFTEA
jgi:hypothetical protein